MYMIVCDMLVKRMIMNTLSMMNDVIIHVMLMDDAYMSACIWYACGNVWTRNKEGSIKKGVEGVWSDDDEVYGVLGAQT